jgi:LysR family transcriptional regulator, low CO2-responsive transcriptional regulator
MPFPSGIVDAIDPARLRLLVEVQRQGSISGAAEACRISQPSATKHLKTLEGALGEKLVERNGRASRLTEAGEIVASHGVRVLDSLHGLEEELQALRDAETGTLALAASTTPGSYVLPAILQCFADRHPGVDVDIAIGSSAWVVDQIAKREYSLGIAGEVGIPDGVRAEPFLDDDLVGIAAPGQLKVRRGKATVADLAKRTLLVREPGSSTRGVAERFLARAGYRPANRWELDSNEAIKRSVRAGLGIGFVSRLVVEDELNRDELVSFGIEGAEPMRRSIHLLRPDDREPTPSERAFITTLSDCCAVSVAGCTVVNDRSPA